MSQEEAKPCFGYTPDDDLSTPTGRQAAAKQLSLRHSLGCSTYFDVVQLGEDISDALNTKADLASQAVRMEWRSAIMADLEARNVESQLPGITISRELWLIMGRPDGFERVDADGNKKDIWIKVRAEGDE